jgi:hypothetical protein
MIENKSITLFTVGWGDEIAKVKPILDYCKEIFPYFDEVIFYDKITNLYDYNKFFVEELNNVINTDFVLTIQSDGYILNPSKWDNYFLKFDYVGAPWPWYSLCGNGGFSLRSKKFLEFSSLLKYNRTHHEYTLCPEDYFLCVKNRDYFINNKCKFSSMDVGLRFSFEHHIPLMPNHKINDSFGFHGKHNLK